MDLAQRALAGDETRHIVAGSGKEPEQHEAEEGTVSYMRRTLLEATANLSRWHPSCNTRVLPNIHVLFT